VSCSPSSPRTTWKTRPAPRPRTLRSART
jgi:hypothetical protein